MCLSNDCHSEIVCDFAGKYHVTVSYNGHLIQKGNATFTHKQSSKLAQLGNNDIRRVKTSCLDNSIHAEACHKCFPNLYGNNFKLWMLKFIKNSHLKMVICIPMYILQVCMQEMTKMQLLTVRSFNMIYFYCFILA